MATLPELTFKINNDLVNALNQTTAENNLLRQIIKTLNPGVKVNINDIVYVDGRPLDVPPQYISDNKYLCRDDEYVKSMPAPKEAELWPPPCKSMTEENVTKLKEDMTILEQLTEDKKRLSADLKQLNKEFTEQAIQIEEKNIKIHALRKALEDIQYMIDPMGSTGNDTIYNIALNALKK